MVKIASEHMECLREADMVLMDSLPNDKFLNEFGAWPDQAFCLTAEQGANEGRLIYRGEFIAPIGDQLGGVRSESFSVAMKRILPSHTATAI